VLVFGSLAWAIGSLYSRRAPLPRRPLVGVAMQMLAGGLMLTVVGAVSGEFGRLHPAAVSLESWLGLAYLVAAGSVLGFTAYMWLLGRRRPRSSARMRM
jgi:drug/metabolite transporter (DMT)-like permease